MRVWLLHHMTDKYSRTRTLWQALFWRKSLLSCYILSFFFNIDRTFTPYTIQLCWCVEIDLFGWHILSSSQMNWIWRCFVLGPLYWAGDQISNMGRIQGERGSSLTSSFLPLFKTWMLWTQHFKSAHVCIDAWFVDALVFVVDHGFSTGKWTCEANRHQGHLSSLWG